MENLIELLKKNWFPLVAWQEPECYGPELGKKMQDKANEIGKREFYYYDNDWRQCSEGHFFENSIYRLRSDYEEKPEEPEIVECEICYDERHLHFDHERVRHSPREAYDQSDFIGFKFDDGTVFGSPVKYSVPGETSHGYYAYYGAIKTGQALEHHATHVLFRRPK